MKWWKYFSFFALKTLTFNGAKTVLVISWALQCYKWKRTLTHNPFSMNPFRVESVDDECLVFRISGLMRDLTFRWRRMRCFMKNDKNQLKICRDSRYRDRVRYQIWFCQKILKNRQKTGINVEVIIFVYFNSCSWTRLKDLVLSSRTLNL